MVDDDGKTVLLAKKGEDSSSSAPVAAAEDASESSQQSTEALLPKSDTRSSPQLGTAGGNRLQIVYGLGFAFIIVVASIALLAPREKSSFARQGQNWGFARAQKKLGKPLLIVISSDGFRWGYNYKVPTPNIDKLRLNGTEAEAGLIPVYPSLTFPNHYSIATGLYPAWHGIIENSFSDPYDPEGEPFHQANMDPKWWLGEPIWVTVTKNGLQAATYFWPGSEVVKDPWTCPAKFCMPYNGSVPYEERVDTVLTYFDLPSKEIPSYMSLYFESPDEEAHLVGPDAPQISEAVAKIDTLVGRLITGLEKKGVFEDVSIVFLGDHGMAPNCDAKVIYVSDFNPWVEIDPQWIDYTGAIFGLRLPAEVDVKDVYNKMQKALASGKVENGEFLELYLKEDFPERFLFSYSDRVQPILGIPAEGFKVVDVRSNASQCGGSHGYDNALLSMRTVFIAHGPQFARGRKVPTFINVELYNVFTSILGLRGAAPNNGSKVFPSTLLLPPE